jgi:hypothetical protein
LRGRTLRQSGLIAGLAGDRLFRRTLERHLRRRRGHGPAMGRAHDVALDHAIIRPAQHDEMLDIVTAQQHELALAVEIIDIDDTQPRLTPASALATHGETLAADPLQDDGEQGQKDRDDREGDDVLNDG